MSRESTSEHGAGWVPWLAASLTLAVLLPAGAAAEGAMSRPVVLAPAPAKVRRHILGGFARACITAGRLAFILLMVALIVIMATGLIARAFGHPTLAVLGGSMGDSLPVGSLAITDWQRPSDIKIGDVIVVGLESNTGHLPVIHRVIDIEPDGGNIVFYTKGDANKTADPNPSIFPKTARVAELTEHIPYAGFALHFVRTPLGWALLVLGPLAALALNILVGIWRGVGGTPKSAKRSTGLMRWVRGRH